MIKGITVTLYERTQTGVDALNAPVYTETPVNVANVLVTPSSAEDVVDDMQLYGRRSEYELSIPKGDTHEWTGNRVEFFGQAFRVFTPAREWIEENVPLAWNKKYKVERYE